MVPGPEAYRAGLQQVCLPSLLEGTPSADRAAALGLQPLPDRLLPNRVSRGDRAWYMPTLDTTLVVAWADGSCSVRMLKGDPEATFAVVQAMLRARPEHFNPGAVAHVGQDLVGIAYCEAKRPNPVVVAFIRPTPGSRHKPVASSTVFRSGVPGEPEPCVFAQQP